MLRWFLIVTILIAGGCGQEPLTESVTKVIPDIPANTSSFGPLYPRIASYLNARTPDIVSATRDTLAWARHNIAGFDIGSCASINVIPDWEFVRLFGRATLGVTLPWMEIYIRDGNRSEGFFWKEPSLLVSTVLHESVHAMQRVRQARKWLRPGTNCAGARDELVRRRDNWTSGFNAVRTSADLTNHYPGEEQALIHRWVSPIERARDEVEAAIVTVKWMADHSTELNALTTGGANNWAYGVQFLNQLKLLATSNCFSPDPSAFEDEKRIYTDEIPAFVAEFQRYEEEMRYYLSQRSNVPALRMRLSDAEVSPAPSGRQGSRCSFAELPEFPQFPVPDDITLLEHVHSQMAQ